MDQLGALEDHLWNNWEQIANKLGTNWNHWGTLMEQLGPTREHLLNNLTPLGDNLGTIGST